MPLTAAPAQPGSGIVPAMPVTPSGLQPPVVICPFVYEHERDEIMAAFGFGQPGLDDIAYYLWHDTERIGPERAFEHCWSQFPDRDIIIVHSDMRPPPDVPKRKWYDDLCRFRADYPNVGMLACTLMYPQSEADPRPRIQCAGGRYENGDVSHIHGPITHVGSVDGVSEDVLEKVRECPWVTFGGVLIRREVLDACGPIDRGYSWAYVMDVDYCFHARELGFRLVQVPVTLIHEESRTTTSVVSEDVLHARHAANMDRFRQKWGSRAARLPHVSGLDPLEVDDEVERLRAALSFLRQRARALELALEESVAAASAAHVRAQVAESTVSALVSSYTWRIGSRLAAPLAWARRRTPTGPPAEEELDPSTS